MAKARRDAGHHGELVRLIVIVDYVLEREGEAAGAGAGVGGFR
jgi:hypothetical protein